MEVSARQAPPIRTWSPGLPLPLVDAFRSREPGGHRIFQPPLPRPVPRRTLSYTVGPLSLGRPPCPGSPNSPQHLQARNWRRTAWARNPSTKRSHTHTHAHAHAHPTSERSFPRTHAYGIRTRPLRYERICRRTGPLPAIFALHTRRGRVSQGRDLRRCGRGREVSGGLWSNHSTWNPAESRTPCLNEPRSRRPLRNVRAQWDEGALSNPGAGNWDLEKSRRAESARTK